MDDVTKAIEDIVMDYARPWGEPCDCAGERTVTTYLCGSVFVSCAHKTWGDRSTNCAGRACLRGCVGAEIQRDGVKLFVSETVRGLWRHG